MSNAAAYLANEALKGGNEVTIRDLRPDDKERLLKAFLHLLPQAIRAELRLLLSRVVAQMARGS